MINKTRSSKSSKPWSIFSSPIKTL